MYTDSLDGVKRATGDTGYDRRWRGRVTEQVWLRFARSYREEPTAQRLRHHSQLVLTAVRRLQAQALVEQQGEAGQPAGGVPELEDEAQTLRIEGRLVATN